MDLDVLNRKLQSLDLESVQQIEIEEYDRRQVVTSIQRQLEAGTRGDGEPMKPYADVTVRIKRQTGGYISPSGRIALKDQGDFYAGMVATPRRGYLETGSTDRKAAELVGRYGTAVLALTEENHVQIHNDARPRIVDRVERQLGLK